MKDQAIFECQMGDEEAEAEWKVAGEVVTENDRIQIKKLGKGVHKLIILHARKDIVMTDRVLEILA